MGGCGVKRRQTGHRSGLHQRTSNRFRQSQTMRGGKYTTDRAKQDNLKVETL